MKRIGLYGIGGLYNYGCEAIIRGAVANIRKIDNTCEITYYSRCYEYDKKQIKDLNIKIVNIESKNNIIKKIINKCIDIFKLPIILFNKGEYREVVENSDIILSIGGDIYSIPKYKRKQKKYQYVNRMVEFGEYAKKRGKKVIIYGASIGPFGEYSRAKEYFINHLKKVDLIVCREKYSIEYLLENGIKENLIFLPDPAYLVGDNIKKENTKKYIGINLSALSIHEIYGNLSDETIDRISKLLDSMVEKLQMPIMLIPHVYSPWDKFDNDYEFLNKLYSRMSLKTKKNVKVVKPVSFIDVKNYLIECKIVVAARMHCAVNAITESIPTIFLSYSIKSQGMSEFVYNDLRWFLKLNEIEDKLLELVTKMNNDYSGINKLLLKRNTEICALFEENNEAHCILKNIILGESN
ncbi:MAG: polysaccharide pyruvyl transferase family protein [Clostridium sp.]|nr:polysaccharide pyruvyl transferase family protein [Clostridium sp.]MDU7084335.1 polysaccharide pyruvyl transferase family protein [Clostridium sp.]